MEKNVFRFVVFVLWLETQPRSCLWYDAIKKKHPTQIPSIQQILETCSKQQVSLLSLYHDPGVAGSLWGVRRFALAQHIPLSKAKKVLEQDLGYTLHKPGRQHFSTLPVLVYGIDEQWVANLVEVQRLSKNDRGNRYLLTIIDVLSKFAWVQALKAETGTELVKALEKILKGG